MDGIEIRCRHDTWAGHIADEHLELEGQQSAVSATIQEPIYIYQSGRYPRRRVFYRPFVLPAPFQRNYLLVVIEYRGGVNRRRGEVITAFATINIKEGDILIWSKY